MLTKDQTSQKTISNTNNPIEYLLTNREKECLSLTIRGKSSKQVTYELSISSRTVEEYLNNIKKKLGVFSKAELIEKTFDLYIQCVHF